MVLSVGANIKDEDMGMDAIIQQFQSADGHFVETGVFGKQGSDLVRIAAANHFGAEINHPGGTAYGFRNEKDLRENKIRFLKKGQGIFRLGFTPAHKINIPARPFITSAVDDNSEKYGRMTEKLGKRILDGEIDKKAALRLAGEVIKSDIQRKIRTGPFVPNAPSTLRAKRPKRKPLINTGRLRQSIVSALGQGNETDDGDLF